MSRTSTLLFPIYPIATPQELVLPCEKNIGFLIHPRIFFSSAKDEWVSWKNKNLLEPKLFLKYSNTLIYLREFCSPLALLDIKCGY